MGKRTAKTESTGEAGSEAAGSWRDYIYYEDEQTIVLNGDVRTILPLLKKGLPPEWRPQTCVTSPPYLWLRDYGTAEWDGGDSECDHALEAWASDAGNVGPAALRANEAKSVQRSAGKCRKCGALRIDQQLGSEATPAEYLSHMVRIFDDVRHVLRPGATAWVNMGDKQNGTGNRTANIRDNGDLSFRSSGQAVRCNEFKDKDMMMIPAELAIALRNAGWWLRAEIVWDKRNPMPESVNDRPTKAHEMIYLLANAKHYFYDKEAVKEPVSGTAHARGNGVNPKTVERDTGIRQNTSFSAAVNERVPTRNLRSVWSMTTEPFNEAHFAVFPASIPERCIKAGTSEKGQCAKCGQAYKRIVETATSFESGSGRSGNEIKGKGPHALEYDNKNLRKGPVVTAETVGWSTNGKGRDRSNGNRNGKGASTLDAKEIPQKETAGWEGCECGETATVPQVVLDCFGGAGTTGLVAKRLGRRAILIELNPEYCKMIVRRLQNYHKPEKRVKVREELPLFEV